MNMFIHEGNILKHAIYIVADLVKLIDVKYFNAMTFSPDGGFDLFWFSSRAFEVIVNILYVHV